MSSTTITSNDVNAVLFAPITEREDSSESDTTTTDDTSSSTTALSKIKNTLNAKYSIHLTKIPLLTKIITFASLTPKSPLLFSRVHSSWDETVRDFSAVSHVWKSLFSEAFFSHPLHVHVSNTIENKRDSIAKLFNNNERVAKTQDGDQSMNEKMKTKQYLVPLIKNKNHHLLLWYLEKVFDAGIDHELLWVDPINKLGTCLHLALAAENAVALDIIFDAILNRPKNREKATFIFNFSSKEKSVKQPIFYCLEGKDGQTKPRSLAKLLQHAPAFVDVNVDPLISDSAVKQFPLWKICESGLVRCAKELIPIADRVHLDVNQTNQGINSLFIACQNGHDQIVDLLLNHLPQSCALEVNGRDSNLGMSCAYIAAGKKRVKCLKLLLEDPRTDKTLVTNLNACPLHICAQECKTDDEDGLACLRLLIDAGYPMNGVHSTSYTPIAAAVAKGNKAATKLLISRGADTKWSSRKYKNLAELAKASGHGELIHECLGGEGPAASIGSRIKNFFKSLGGDTKM